MKRMIIAISALGLLAVSCTKTEMQPTAFDPEDGVKITLPVSVTTEAPQTTATKSAGEQLQSPSMDVDYGLRTKSVTEMTTLAETQVNNLWVLQYEAATGALVGTPQYIPSGIVMNGNTVEFTVTLTAKTTPQILYYIANTGDAARFNATNAATVTQLNELAEVLNAELNPAEPAGKGLLMLGRTRTAKIDASEKIGATLRRLVAKVKFKYTVDAAFGGFTATGIRLLNVARNISFRDAPAPGSNFPANVSGSHFSYPPEAAIPGKEYVWYVPENLRQTAGTIGDATERTITKTDGMATYIEITGTYDGKTLVYSLLLGDVASSVADFNVQRNYIYSVTVNIKGAEASDARVEIEEAPAVVSAAANAFMVTPGGAVTFNARKEGNSADASLATTKVEVLWQDHPSLIRSVSFDGTNATVNTRNVLDGGNALVAAYNAADQIIWSWHIWVTDYQPSQMGTIAWAQNSRYTVPGGEVHTYGESFETENGQKTIMDRDLGATKTYYLAPVYNDSEVQRAFGLYYQWGRKDPFQAWNGVMTDTGIEAEHTAVYDISGAKIDGMPFKEFGRVTQETANQNPHTFYYLVSPYDWRTPGDDALWGNEADKTEYDPCPAGWRIPPSGTWNSFKSTGGDPDEVFAGTLFQYYINGMPQMADGTPAFVKASQNGRLYRAGSVAAWYPASGMIYRNTGSLAGIGNEGRRWSSKPRSTNLAYHLLFTYNTITTQSVNSRYRSFGYPVRCIQE